MTSALSMMNRTCKIQRPVQGLDASSSPTLVFVTIRERIRCAVDQMTGSEARRYDRESSVKLYSGIFPPEVALNEKDRVAVPNIGTLEVLNVYPVAGSDGGVDYIEAGLELTA